MASDASAASLPLSGVRVIELAGLAPVPFCGLVLADFGADVVRIDRAGPRTSPDWLARGKRSVALDLKSTSGRRVLARLIANADVLLDPYRPGTLESLGLAPEELRKRNRRLIVARLTGYGQGGPYARMAGHDLNYLALSGILSQLGRADSVPTAPGNLLADFAGGGLACALGIVLALYERTKTGEGQVIDAAMMDGALYLSSFVWHAQGTPLWSHPRGQNVLDSGAPWYDCYATKDGHHVSVAALEPHFYALLLEKLGPDFVSRFGDEQNDRTRWPELRTALTTHFASQTLTEVERVFAGTDACVAPVLPLDPAALTAHAQHRARGVLGLDGTPLPAPRLSRAAPVQAALSGRPQPRDGEHTVTVLRELGVPEEELRTLLEEQVIRQAKL